MNEEHKLEEEQTQAGRTAAAVVSDSEREAWKKDFELRSTETEQQRTLRLNAAQALFDRGGAADATATATPAEESAAALLSSGEAKEFRIRWDAIQAGFVDEPRHAVEEADHLVADAMKRLGEVFAEERVKLEGQWDRKDTESTESLRLALRRYRSFFGRLLAI